MAYKRITYDDRLVLEDLLNVQKQSISEIARNLDIGRSTVYAELKRCKGPYNAKEAQLTVNTRHD